jgi:hypothetical protein
VKLRLTTLVCIPIALLASGCLGTLTVSELDGQGKRISLPGIPFYAVEHLRRQVTVETRHLVELTLLVQTAPEKDKPASTIRSLVRYAGPNELAAIKAISADLGSNTKAIPEAFLNLPASPDLVNSDWVVVENRIEQTSRVDGTRRYFVNSRLPWIGTGQITPELAPDGTLQKVTAESDSKAGELVAAALDLALGISDFTDGSTPMTGASDRRSTESVATDPPTAPHIFVLLEEQLYETRTYTCDLDTTVSKLPPPLDQNRPGNGFKIERSWIKPMPAPASPGSPTKGKGADGDKPKS